MSIRDTKKAFKLKSLLTQAENIGIIEEDP